MTEFEKRLEKLREAGVSEELIQDLKDERRSKNEADKEKRKTNTKIINDLMEKLEVESKQEVLEKASNSASELKKLKEELNSFKDEIKNKERLNKELEIKGKISDILNSKGLKVTETVKAGLFARLLETEDGYQIDGLSLEEAIQKEFVDDVESVRNSDLKVESNNKSDYFTDEEMNDLTEEQMANPDVMEKVNRTMERKK